ncbi:hypothetical protein BGW36DRAFT_294401 [Talaromyces proteolyticus]|uniref:Homeobox and C2H2 transcription factor n=1 Tax=Talaromyces proteolyticus TaxID=1131652 RepID=A0AAD4KT69_9EURO|nr:uncharacterized protein BGW36DRAFT_294401 [Talaromyces proteolyticus]KAH8698768.1 hypothetical protein BGW36DRAFT_294401 [Talaromyces proteolyticus]
MEYFNFEEASFSSNIMQDDVASDCLEMDEADAVENFDSLFFDKSFQLHSSSAAAAETEHLSHPELEALPVVSSSDIPEPVAGSEYPMFRSTEPCDFCRRMGFDCFLIQRGVLNNGCTCCVSLYRECSFTHAKAPGKFLHTLHTVGEDAVTSTGGLTGRRALKSVGSNKFDDLESRGRKSGARFGRDPVRILKTWLSEHYQHPYPTEEEKIELKERTGLKRSQIANWLANARRRGKVRPPARSISPIPGAVNIPGQSSTSSSSSSPSIDMSLMTPLERWKHSPPENEPASTSAIIRAMASTPFRSNSPSHHQQQQFQPRPSLSGHGKSVSRKTGSSNDSSSMFQAPSVSSFETENKSSISDFSFASAFSHRSSQHSLNSSDRKERRRRRKQIPPVPPFERQKTRGARIFQCTFCTDSFPAKYDWQRHEKSLHLALEKWGCAPQGGVMLTSDGQKACAFCREPNPTEDHLETHNYSSCQEKTMQERTFYRKDHLNQHLRLMHNVKFDSWMNQWRSTTSEIKSRCGFCDAQFTTWKDRADHLAQHFKNGADMSQWKGDWGFEPYVRRLVENAVPPYLIAEDRVSPNPYKAAWPSNASNRSSSQLRVSQDANCFVRLERELKSFIEGKLEAGIIPSDQSIQDQGRITIYGSDDTWNQTCADNPVWLSILKRDCGIAAVPDSEHLQLDDLGMQPPYAGGIQRPPLETNPMAGHLRKTWLSKVSLDSPAASGSGLHSPGFPSSGFHSAAPSMPGSLAGSFVGSTGVSSGVHVPGLSSGWSSGFSAADQSSSAPVSAMADPYAGVGLDSDFLEQFDKNLATLPAGIENFGATDFNLQEFPSEEAPQYGQPAKNGQVYPLSTSETQPISIPTGTSLDQNLQQYADLSYMEGSNYQ